MYVLFIVLSHDLWMSVSAQPARASAFFVQCNPQFSRSAPSQQLVDDCRILPELATLPEAHARGVYRQLRQQARKTSFRVRPSCLGCGLDWGSGIEVPEASLFVTGALLHQKRLKLSRCTRN